MDTNDKDSSPSGRNQEGNENLEPQWFTEGYIGEVEVNLASTDKCTITIDPSAPFKVEHQEKKFIFLASSNVIESKPPKKKSSGGSHSSTSPDKPGGDVGDSKEVNLFEAKLIKLSHELSLDVKICHEVEVLMLTGLKERHQKIRFGITEERDEKFKLVKFTLI